MRVIVVEDNQSVAQAIAFVLRDQGHAVDILVRGDEADAFVAQDRGADLVILDLNLPGMGGLEVLRSMRARADMRPVLLLTARGETADRVAGLDAGADDYLVKPFEMEELLARLRALLRRGTPDEGPMRQIGGLRWSADTRQLLDGERAVDLPRRELALFEALVRAGGRTASKQDLLDQLYGVGADVEETVVEVHVSRLRKRLAPFGLQIRVRRGLGYELAETGA